MPALAAARVSAIKGALVFPEADRIVLAAVIYHEAVAEIGAHSVEDPEDTAVRARAAAAAGAPPASDLAEEVRAAAEASAAVAEVVAAVDGAGRT